MSEKVGENVTLDVLCQDGLRLLQQKTGYRFSMDPLFLANFLRLKRGETMLDVGTGCGIIPLYLSRRGFTNRIVGIEIQEELYTLAVRNRQLNGCENVSFIMGDVTGVVRGLGTFDVVVSNPPYRGVRTGRKNPVPSRRLARHESLLDLPSLMSISNKVLFEKGRLYVIYPAKRLGEVMGAAAAERLEPKRIRFVHSREGEPAILFLLECVKGAGREIKVENPLYVYKDDRYTNEVEGYYR